MGLTCSPRAEEHQEVGVSDLIRKRALQVFGKLLPLLFVSHPNSGARISSKIRVRPKRIIFKIRFAVVLFRSHHHARRLGIGMVFQHFSLFETLTVAENISLSMDEKAVRLGPRIAELGDRFGLPLDPAALVHSLSVGQRQRAEIIRCLLLEPRLIIMDEPTSVLPPSGWNGSHTTILSIGMFLRTAVFRPRCSSGKKKSRSPRSNAQSYTRVAFDEVQTMPPFRPQKAFKVAAEFM